MTVPNGRTTVPSAVGQNRRRIQILEAVAGGGSGSGYDTVEDEGTPLTQRSTIDFQGGGVTAADSGGVTVVTIPGGSSGYDTVEDEGTPLTQRSTIDFQGAGVTAADTGGVTVVTIPGGSGPGNDGWVSAAETWTYSSADGPTGVFTVAADVTAKYSVGMRVRYVQTTTKYGIVTKVSTFSGGNTTVTIYGGTDYTTANAAISANYYSTSKAPFGFPLSPAKWTETVISTADDRQANPTNGTWYNDASLQISVPIGVWNVRYSGNLLVSRAASSDMFANATLSTANNSESDANWTIVTYRNAGSAQENTVQMDGLLTLTAKTTHYLNVRTLTTSITSLGFYGPDAPTIIRAVCAYL